MILDSLDGLKLADLRAAVPGTIVLPKNSPHCWGVRVAFPDDRKVGFVQATPDVPILSEDEGRRPLPTLRPTAWRLHLRSVPVPTSAINTPDASGCLTINEGGVMVMCRSSAGARYSVVPVRLSDWTWQPFDEDTAVRFVKDWSLSFRDADSAQWNVLFDYRGQE